MADTKISALPAAAALGGTELIPGVQSAANVAMTPAQVKTYTSNGPFLVTPNLGTPTAGVLSNCTGLPLSSVTGLGTNVATALGVNVGSAGAFVTFNGAGGTPSSLTLTNASGLPVSTGVSGLGTGVATALAVNTGTAGCFVVNGGALGTPASGNFSTGSFTWPTFNQNTTGSAAKWTTARDLAGNSVDGSANVAFSNKFIVQGTTDAGLSGAQFLGSLSTGLVKNTTTTGVLSIAAAGTDYVAPGGALGTPSSGTLTNATGLPISTGVSGLGTGVATALAVNTGSSGSIITQPAAFTGNALKVVRVNAGETAFELATAGSGSPGGSDTQLQYNNAGAFGGTSGITTDGLNLTIASGTITANKPFSITQTWNNGAVSFYGIDMNITQTAYGGGALMRLQVGGVTKFNVRYDGNTDVPTLNVGTPTGNTWCGIWNNTVDIVSGGKIGFNSASAQIYSGSMDTNIMRVAAGILGVRNGSTGGAAISLVEQTAPSAPATNGVYIYAEDNGSGKTRLMALFPTGAAQQIAIEP